MTTDATILIDGIAQSAFEGIEHAYRLSSKDDGTPLATFLKSHSSIDGLADTLALLAAIAKHTSEMDAGGMHPTDVRNAAVAHLSLTGVLAAMDCEGAIDVHSEAPGGPLNLL